MSGVSVLEYPSPQEALDNEQHVYFPPGKYDGPFLLRPFQTVEGAGPGSVDDPDAGGTVLVSNDGAPVIARKESSPLTVSNIILRDFAVVHEGTGAPAVDLPGLRSSTLEQLAVLSVEEDGLKINAAEDAGRGTRAARKRRDIGAHVAQPIRRMLVPGGSEALDLLRGNGLRVSRLSVLRRKHQNRTGRPCQRRWQSIRGL